MSTANRTKLDVSSARFSQLSTHSSLPSEMRHEEACGAIQVDKRVNQETFQQLLQIILTHPVLSHLRSDDQHALIENLLYYEIGANEHLYEAGSPSNNIYFLSSGTVVLQSKTAQVLITTPGMIFGEQAIYGGMRLESACTLDATTFWMLGSDILQVTLSRLRKQMLPQAKSVLQSCGLDFYLSPAELNQMAQELLPCRYQHGEKVVTQGHRGELLYFVASGSATVLKDDRLLHVLNPGEYFGEQALIYDGMRLASVEPLEEMQCFAIDRLALMRCMGNYYDELLYRNCITVALEQSETLSTLPDSARTRLISAMKLQVYTGPLVTAGTSKGEKLWLILRGHLQTQAGETIQTAVLGAEDVLSEESTGCYEQDLVPDSPEVLVAEIGRTEFYECLGRSVTSLDPCHVPLFADLPEDVKSQLKLDAEVCIFAAGETIISEEASLTHVFVIKDGSVRITRNGRYLRTFSRYDSIGEYHLFLRKECWVTAVAERDLECWRFPIQKVAPIISETTRFALTRSSQSETLELSDLLCVETLDSGQFGCVCYSLSSKPEEYAVKCISRTRIESGKLQHDLLNERDVLLRINHPMCVKLHRTLQDTDNIYFVMEYVDGALLHDVLYGLGQCTDIMAKFYLGCLVLIFEHLQQRNIVYRDLKPENLMVDSKGFLKLIDFGSAKVVTGRTRTVIGTPQFMAPEMILGKAYTRAVDMWGLGVVLYDLLCGGVPWGEGQEDVFIVFQQVLSAPLKFPDFVPQDSPARHLISQLLTRDPVSRATLDDLKHHEFMMGVDFDSLRPGQCNPPFLPKPVNRSKDIKAARVNPKSWSDELAKANLDEELDLPVSRPGACPEDWDREF